MNNDKHDSMQIDIHRPRILHSNSRFKCLLSGSVIRDQFSL